MKTLVMALALIGMAAGPAMAFQCPLLLKQIQDATAGKTDAGSKKALEIAAEGEKLHKEGKHAESVAKMEEAAKVISLSLKKK
jgi:hypothetical protein